MAEVRRLVTVVAPGAGTSWHNNGAVYSELDRSPSFRSEILGQSGSGYDRYPEAFGGSPAPNLESFAWGMLDQGVVDRSDCLVVGSRGGQVVLPYFWKNAGATMPPAVVINGGCAMELTEAPCWPDEAVTFLLIGGHDYFRAQSSLDGYVDDVKGRVPARNTTTVVLFVREMGHMPQPALLRAVLRPAISGLLTWQGSRKAPLDDFQLILASLTAGGFSGVLAYTKFEGGWQDLSFGAKESVPRACAEPSACAAQEAAACPSPCASTAPGSDLAEEDDSFSCSSAVSPRSDGAVRSFLDRLFTRFPRCGAKSGPGRC
jgi:hypothetical protein